jgi:hypothetical protein
MQTGADVAAFPQRAPGFAGTGEVMGIVTEQESAVGGYPAAAVPGGPGEAGGAVLHRRSALATRRSVLYVLSHRDAFVAEDLISWYAERGFHFYVADLRGGVPQRRQDCLAALDAARRQLGDGDGADMIVVSAHAAGALVAALWCDARRDDGVADALILSGLVLGRRLRRGLDIACPVLVICPPVHSDAGGPGPRGARLGAVLRRRETAARLGAHVTWLQLDGGLPGQVSADDSGEGQRRFLDEVGRWLGAYMYGKVRDQLL